MKKYDNFHTHLMTLSRASEEDLGNEFIISGIIDKFFVQFELGWKVLKELLLQEGDLRGQTGSPREIIKAAFSCFDFLEEEIWLRMLRERNDCTHIYNEDMAKELVKHILEIYIPEFQKMDKAVIEKISNANK